MPTALSKVSIVPPRLSEIDADFGMVGFDDAVKTSGRITSPISPIPMSPTNDVSRNTSTQHTEHTTIPGSSGIPSQFTQSAANRTHNSFVVAAGRLHPNAGRELTMGSVTLVDLESDASDLDDGAADGRGAGAAHRHQQRYVHVHDGGGGSTAALLQHRLRTGSSDSDDSTVRGSTTDLEDDDDYCALEFKPIAPAGAATSGGNSGPGSPHLAGAAGGHQSPSGVGGGGSGTLSSIASISAAKRMASQWVARTSSPTKQPQHAATTTAASGAGGGSLLRSFSNAAASSPFVPGSANDTVAATARPADGQAAPQHQPLAGGGSYFSFTARKVSDSVRPVLSDVNGGAQQQQQQHQEDANYHAVTGATGARATGSMRALQFGGLWPTPSATAASGNSSSTSPTPVATLDKRPPQAQSESDRDDPAAAAAAGRRLGSGTAYSNTGVSERLILPSKIADTNSSSKGAIAKIANIIKAKSLMSGVVAGAAQQMSSTAYSYKAAGVAVPASASAGSASLGSPVAVGSLHDSSTVAAAAAAAPPLHPTRATSMAAGADADDQQHQQQQILLQRQQSANGKVSAASATPSTAASAQSAPGGAVTLPSIMRSPRRGVSQSGASFFGASSRAAVEDAVVGGAGTGGSTGAGGAGLPPASPVLSHQQKHALQYLSERDDDTDVDDNGRGGGAGTNSDGGGGGMVHRRLHPHHLHHTASATPAAPEGRLSMSMLLHHQQQQQQQHHQHRAHKVSGAGTPRTPTSAAAAAGSAAGGGQRGNSGASGLPRPPGSGRSHVNHTGKRRHNSGTSNNTSTVLATVPVSGLVGGRVMLLATSASQVAGGRASTDVNSAISGRLRPLQQPGDVNGSVLNGGSSMVTSILSPHNQYHQSELRVFSEPQRFDAVTPRVTTHWQHDDPVAQSYGFDQLPAPQQPGPQEIQVAGGTWDGVVKALEQAMVEHLSGSIDTANLSSDEISMLLSSNSLSWRGLHFNTSEEEHGGHHRGSNPASYVHAPRRVPASLGNASGTALSLACLRVLSLTGCGLTAANILQLPLMPALVACDLSDNALIGLGAMTGLPSKTRTHDPVAASAGSLETVCWLAFAPRLKHLILRGCGLTSVPALIALEDGCLQSLDVSCNKISFPAGFDSVASSLAFLDVSLNDVSSMLSLRALSTLRMLAALKVHPNPVTLTTQPAMYRAQLIDMMPQLAVLDDQPTPPSSYKTKMLKMQEKGNGRALKQSGAAHGASARHGNGAHGNHSSKRRQQYGAASQLLSSAVQLAVSGVSVNLNSGSSVDEQQAHYANDGAGVADTSLVQPTASLVRTRAIPITAATTALRRSSKLAAGNDGAVGRNGSPIGAAILEDGDDEVVDCSGGDCEVGDGTSSRRMPARVSSTKRPRRTADLQSIQSQRHRMAALATPIKRQARTAAEMEEEQMAMVKRQQQQERAGSPRSVAAGSKPGAVGTANSATAAGTSHQSARDLQQLRDALRSSGKYGGRGGVAGMHFTHRPGTDVGVLADASLPWYQQQLQEEITALASQVGDGGAWSTGHHRRQRERHAGDGNIDDAARQDWSTDSHDDGDDSSTTSDDDGSASSSSSSSSYSDDSNDEDGGSDEEDEAVDPAVWMRAIQSRTLVLLAALKRLMKLKITGADGIASSAVRSDVNTVLDQIRTVGALDGRSLKRMRSLVEAPGSSGDTAADTEHDRVLDADVDLKTLAASEMEHRSSVIFRGLHVETMDSATTKAVVAVASEVVTAIAALTIYVRILAAASTSARSGAVAAAVASFRSSLLASAVGALCAPFLRSLEALPVPAAAEANTYVTSRSAIHARSDALAATAAVVTLTHAAVAAEPPTAPAPPSPSASSEVPTPAVNSPAVPSTSSPSTPSLAVAIVSSPAQNSNGSRAALLATLRMLEPAASSANPAAAVVTTTAAGSRSTPSSPAREATPLVLSAAASSPAAAIPLSPSGSVKAVAVAGASSSSTLASATLQFDIGDDDDEEEL